MKNKENTSGKLSRRKFLGTAAFAATGTLLPSVLSYGSNPKVVSKTGNTSDRIPNSQFSGVQIGAITYSFRDLKGGLEATLNACIEAGLSSVELMGTGVEDYLGAPKTPVQRRPAPDNPFTAEEKRSIAQYNSELKEWRKTNGTINAYTHLRKKFNDAGVNIHIYKWTAGDTEEELDYSFKVAKALGAIGITAEINEQNARLLGPAAKNNGMYAILHNHAQFAEPGFDVDKLLSYSSANMLNFDVGHYFGSTGLNPADFIRKYHERIASIHLKDKTGPDNITAKNANQVWGQGETPIAEVLHLIRDQKLPIYCDIELEYPVAPWSTSVKEVKTCKEFCRQILI
ncbi:sugar phosphate isomerase/epimerase family protein [Proteiniphilum acetatigenes]|uniref:sugar phosphate isomerase/epimerase family protein n=1 Tax=Proteiniphilum acetatigenes TaxID=294710 RepID=UPI0005C47F2E|nr:TIM barrel protein [Proteiniphilum acetatigenes]SFL33463.1 Sugar phosphate isomerase/epimerase [Porphyromonadaceae bacterium KH3CP3RA]